VAINEGSLPQQEFFFWGNTRGNRRFAVFKISLARVRLVLSMTLNTVVSSWYCYIMLTVTLAILSSPNRDNFLEGSIPNTITTLRNLQQLKLGDNFLISSLPSEVGKLMDMEILEVHVSPLKFALQRYLVMDYAYVKFQFSFELSRGILCMVKFPVDCTI
jgi:hypothetical protein